MTRTRQERIEVSDETRSGLPFAASRTRDGKRRDVHLNESHGAREAGRQGGFVRVWDCVAGKPKSHH